MKNDPITDFLATAAASRLQGIAEDAPLLRLGLLDSVTLMACVAFIEARLNRAVPPAEVVPENFETIAAMRSLVRQLEAPHHV
jgi:acyl carrier protein